MIVDARQLRALRKTLEKEEERARVRAAADTAFRRKAIELLDEAARLGLATRAAANANEGELFAALQAVSRTQLTSAAYPDSGELAALQEHRRVTLEELSAARRQLQSAVAATSDASEFGGAVARQREKIGLAEHLGLDGTAAVCPVCASPSEVGVLIARHLRATLEAIREESVAIERVQPRLGEYRANLDERVTGLRGELQRTDRAIQSWLQQSEQTKQLATVEQMRAHFLGRLSYFFDTVPREADRGRDLTVLRAEIGALEARVDSAAVERRLRFAERKVSEAASQVFRRLPTVAPCVGSELEFFAGKPEVAVVESGTRLLLRMPEVGSDQNYLAIHVALMFGIHRHFAAIAAPVPGLLVIDQLSRPYFPGGQDGVQRDEREVLRGDEDMQAMRRHVDALFWATSQISGLQVVLIEHAYFADDARYVEATRERWNRASGRALIPFDWPERGS